VSGPSLGATSRIILSCASITSSDFRLGRHALDICVSVASLGGCGGPQTPIGACRPTLRLNIFRTINHFITLAESRRSTCQAALCTSRSLLAVLKVMDCETARQMAGVYMPLFPCRRRCKLPRLGRCKNPYPVPPIGGLVGLTSLAISVV
jgi:hypothetical protein